MAPDEKVRAVDNNWLGGGNGYNTACALARLGTPTKLLSKVGDDALGAALVTGLVKEGVDVSDVIVARGRPSSFSTVISDGVCNTRTIIHSPMSDELTNSETEQLL